MLINELMARNDTVLEDEAGEFDDWVELFNSSERAIDLEGFGLGDQSGAPDTLLPAGLNIGAGGFLVLFADDDLDQGARHLAFKLSGGGESVGLFDPQGVLIDELTFGPQQPDVSFGRLPDGDSAVSALSVATPGASNNGALPVDAGPIARDAGPPVEDAGPPLPPAEGVVINEVLLEATAPIADLDGDAVDLGYVELHNTSSAVRSLEGHLLAGWPVHPALQELGPGAFAIAFLEGDPAANVDHMGIELSAPVEVVLTGPSGERVSALSLVEVSSGVAQGPEGTDLTPTPRADNARSPDGGPQITDAGLDGGGS